MQLLDRRVVGVLVRDKESCLRCASIGVQPLAWKSTFLAPSHMAVKFLETFQIKIRIYELPTMEKSVIDSDVLVIDGTVEGESDHHGQVGDLSKAL